MFSRKGCVSGNLISCDVHYIRSVNRPALESIATERRLGCITAALYLLRRKGCGAVLERNREFVNSEYCCKCNVLRNCVTAYVDSVRSVDRPAGKHVIRFRRIARLACIFPVFYRLCRQRFTVVFECNGISLNTEDSGKSYVFGNDIIAYVNGACTV